MEFLRILKLDMIGKTGKGGIGVDNTEENLEIDSYTCGSLGQDKNGISPEFFNKWCWNSYYLEKKKLFFFLTPFVRMNSRSDI